MLEAVITDESASQEGVPVETSDRASKGALSIVSGAAGLAPRGPATYRAARAGPRRDGLAVRL